MNNDSLGKKNFHWQRWWVFLMVFGLAGVLIFSPVESVVPALQAQVTSAVRRGYSLLKKGWVDNAIATFEQALKGSPQSKEGRLGLAIAYQRAGRDADAWAAYQQVLAIDPNNKEALEAVGELGGYRPEWQPDGIEALTTLLNLSPNDTAARAQRALLLGYQGRFPEALADYQIVLESNPTPEIILGAAQIYTYSGDYQQGLELFDRYQASGKPIPGNAAGAYALALRETGNPAQAVEVLEAQLNQFSQFYGNDSYLRADLAKAYQASGQLTEALSVLEPLRGRDEAALPLARALSEIGRREGRSDLTEDAVTLYRQVLASTSKPSSALVREVADVMSEVPTQWASALELYQQLTEEQSNNQSLLVKSNNQSLLVKQIILEGKLGQLSRTQRRQRLLEITQTLPSEAAQQRDLAQALLRLDPPDPELLSVYQDLLATGVDVPFLHFRVAQILIKQNRLAQAISAIDSYRATSTGESDQSTELLLAEIDRRQGNLDATIQRYQRIIQSNPNNNLFYGALRGLAGIHIAQGDPQKALVIYDQLLSRDRNDLLAQLGRSSLAYQTKRIDQEEAEGVLNQWLQTQPSIDPPPELLSLVGVLPADPERETLYITLLEVSPDNAPVQLRRLQVLAQRDPKLAKAEIAEWIAGNPDNIDAYFVQGELAMGLRDLRLASNAYEEILEREPDQIGALLALAGISFTQQHYAKATGFYKQILELEPKNLSARQNLAELSVAQDFPFTALQRFEGLNSEEKESTGTANPKLDNRILRLEVDILKRRGFQPYWERY
ncbi:tetratricopeptide repeat protein [Moorena sp. SIO3A2]|uniref:tetratricopeptide repeat protein n=1 Tax=Moorena sp. SIO3A2 TaxID=2607841 RepID=UPI0013B683B0|nr:tetratricopeptide repeat protein [Moorena sp. SIO3A2]NER85594.1 tetratricopeptide repeat protein [Moorena sp. SIO3A2]